MKRQLDPVDHDFASMEWRNRSTVLGSAYALGANAYMVKPVDLQNVLRLLAGSAARG